MLITSRVSFLCLFVASFMGLWSQDEQPSHETIMAEAHARDVSGIASRSPEGGSIVADTRTNAAPVHIVHKAEVAEQAVLFDVDTPDYIAAGFYRAVSHSGEVRIISVPETDANRSLSARDFYTHETAEDRWYLIRLNTKVLAAGPDTPKQ